MMRKLLLLPALLAVLLIGLIGVPLATAASTPKFQAPFLCGTNYAGDASSSSRHAGRWEIDWQVNKGTPVLAAAGGTVRIAAWQTDNGYGKLIVINHGGGWESYYAHLDKISVKEGQKVVQGQRLGNSGNSTAQIKNMGAHLHYEVRHGSGYPGNVVKATFDGKAFPYSKGRVKSKNCTKPKPKPTKTTSKPKPTTSKTTATRTTSRPKPTKTKPTSKPTTTRPTGKPTTTKPTATKTTTRPTATPSPTLPQKPRASTEPTAGPSTAGPATRGATPTNRPSTTSPEPEAPVVPQDAPADEVPDYTADRRPGTQAEGPRVSPTADEQAAGRQAGGGYPAGSVAPAEAKDSKDSKDAKDTGPEHSGGLARTGN